MTKDFSDMMHLFACAALGKPIAQEITADIGDILKCAFEQNISALVFSAIKPLYEKGNITIDKEYYHRLRHFTLDVASRNIQRNQFMHGVFQQFQENNITYCVLKGELLSRFYHSPNLRISSDTDILIKKQDIKKIKRVLESMNFNIKPLSQTSHHIVAVHPVGGILELHLRLYDELFEDIWFNKCVAQKEPIMIVETSDGAKLPTLGVTDGLIFVTLHCIKHFLSCGMGIKQVMDTLMYMCAYKAQIDWERFWNHMTHLNYHTFVNHLIGIGKEHLLFSENDLFDCSYDKDLINGLLEDIDKGGAFGHEESERFSTYMRYTSERYNRFKAGEFKKYIRKWRFKNIIGAIFPNIKHLATKYPYLKRLPILYPISCLHRIISTGWNIIKKNTHTSKYTAVFGDKLENSTLNRRMSLIKKLDMI